MKKIFSILSVCLCLFFMASCQSDNELSDNNVGYLRLEVGVNTTTNSRADEVYNPKQIAVQILNASGTVVKETSDWTTWSGTQIALEAGTYTLKASSAGFDGQTSAFEKPYYAGSTSFTIAANTEVNRTVTCTLANVKVSVEFSDRFKEYFPTATVTVGALASTASVGSLQFVMGENDTQSAYFPVVDLQATLAVTNTSGASYSQSDDIEGVAARDHYILRYQIDESAGGSDEGNGDVNITVDPSGKTYTYTFNVSTQPNTTLAVDGANAWSNFAYLSGTMLSTETMDAANVGFEYKVQGASTWNKVAATAGTTEGAYTAQATSLNPSTTYEYRMVYGEAEYTSATSTFTTEAATVLPNGNMDSWYQSGKTWYAVSESDYNANGSWWDSSNPGTTTGAGSLINVNPTQGSSTEVHTAGGMSAQLQSQYASAFGIGKFAAASLYAGSFGSLVGTKGAKLNFGQPFTSRPTQLHGWFKYSTGAINYVGDNTPASANIVSGQTQDMCSIYIALATTSYVIDNTDVSTFIDFEGDDKIIAYGELPALEAVSTNGSWKEFNIDLKYKNLTTKPTHIIIVCSASKYGDYFTGSTSSLMYLDDMELVYGTNPTEW